MLSLTVAWVLLAGRVLVATDAPMRSDAVVVLSGDVLGDRLAAGAEVFGRTGSSLLVVFVEHGGVYDAREDVEAFTAAEGVEADRLRLLPPGSSTAQEAGVIAALARRCGWHTITVVTSAYHTGRAGWLVRRALGVSARVAVVADGEPFDAATWWTDDRTTEVVLLEWVKGLSSIRYVVSRPTAPDPGIPC